MTSTFQPINTGDSLIHKRVEVLWSPTMTWYVGTIQKYSMKTGLYHVAYDAKPKINSKDVVTLMSSSATSLKKEKKLKN
jgi:hypothetical protein